MRTNKFFTKKLIAIAAITLAVATAGISSTVAYLKDSTQTLKNTFEVGSIETEIIEVISDLQKEPTVKNVGKNACYIRMRAVVSPSNVAENGLSSVVEYNGNAGYNSSDWVYNANDQFYYYQRPVEPGASTTSLFSHLNAKSLKDGMNFNIVLYQEAVQTYVTTEDGTVISDMNAVWNFYDTYGLQESAQ